MKKLLCLCVSVLMVFSFCSCGKKVEEKKKATVDIEYYANLGQMPEAKYSLGEDIEKVKTELYDYAEENKTVYNVTEGEEIVIIDSGDIKYCYHIGKENKGVSYIISNSEAYGFKLGTVSSEIIAALGDAKYTEEAMNDENTFFMFGSHEGKILKYSFEENTVAFFLIENALCNTAIYNNSDWK